MFLIAFLLACAEAPEAADSGDTGDSPAADDSAEPDCDTAAPSPLDGLVACSPGTPGDRLDLEEACVDGVCLGQTLASADAAYGEGAYCLAFGTDALCFWGDGILGQLRDTDEDGEPDEGARIWQLQATTPWDGTDPAGLGVGLGMDCFVDALGTPDVLSFGNLDGELVPIVAEWTALYLSVFDLQDADYAFVPDGAVESISFENALYR